MADVVESYDAATELATRIMALPWRSRDLWTVDEQADRHGELQEMISAEIESLRARLSQAGAGGGVVVRPLKWRESAVYEWKDLNPSFGRLVVALAETKIGTYGIAKGVQDRFEVWLGDRQIPGSYLTKDEARAAAQADYEARILAALVPSPSAPPGHTDLMVTPESIDAFLEANPPPATPVQPTASVEAVAFPAYGEMPFSELGSAVKAAQFGSLQPYEFDPEFYPGHQIVGTINFNSLNRIVTWFVKRALASLTAPAQGDGGKADRARKIIHEYVGQAASAATSGLSVDDLEGIADDLFAALFEDTSEAQAPSPWTETRLRDFAKSKGWYIREGTSVPDIYNGGWKHPFSVSASSGDLIDMLNAAAPEPVSAPANGVVVEKAARLIAPDAFKAFDDDYRPGQSAPSSAQMRSIGQMNQARETARAILALSNPAPGHGLPAGFLAESAPAGARWLINAWVQKIRGSSWRGRVCGFYFTENTPIGYAVESFYEKGSVQVWPETALGDWTPPTDG